MRVCPETAAKASRPRWKNLAPSAGALAGTVRARDGHDLPCLHGEGEALYGRPPLDQPKGLYGVIPFATLLGSKETPLGLSTGAPMQACACMGWYEAFLEPLL